MQASQFNILVTGTPGSGKTTLCNKLVEARKLQHIAISSLAKSIPSIQKSWNPTLQTYELTEDDENAIMDQMEPIMQHGNVIVEHHDPRMFPERWFQLIVVLRCRTESIFDRLKERGYPQKKIDENVEAEIFGICEEGARESYQKELVRIYQNDTPEQLNATLQELLSIIPQH